MFNPFRSFTSLEELQERMQLAPVNEEDTQAITAALDDELEVSYDELSRVWTEGGTYIADLKEWK